MGEEDMRRQALNVFRMRLLGAEVVPVDRRQPDAEGRDQRGHARLGDQRRRRRTTCSGRSLGAHPYPMMVRDFQAVIGHEARAQILEAEGRLPDTLIACVGGGSNAIGLFHAFLDDAAVRMVGVEAGGRGPAPGRSRGALRRRRAGRAAWHATAMCCRTSDGQIALTHSVSAGLDYAAVGPEHARLRESGRVVYATMGDDDAVAAFRLLAETEGILPALEPAHAIAYVAREAASGSLGELILVNLSGRGDKDVWQVARRSGLEVDEG